MRRMFTACVGLLLLLPMVGCDSREMEKPNLILITIDTLRADYLEPYGAPEGTTPRIAGLAESGVVYTNARTSAGMTIPTHGTILTGLYPRYHGARSNHHRLAPGVVTVASKLAQAGYTTASFVAWPFMHYSADLSRGFTVANGADGPADENDRWADLQPGEAVVAMVADWLTGSPDEPVFLWFHIYEPHHPYEVNEFSRPALEGYDGMLSDGLQGHEMLERDREIVASEEHLDAMHALYRGEVQRADRIIGRLLDALDGAGLRDNSVIVLTADHGEALGDWDHLDGGPKIGHGAAHWESTIRVPLIIADQRTGNRREVGDLVGLVDLAPTLLEYADVEPEPAMQGSPLQPTLDGKAWPETAYFSESVIRTGEAAEASWYDPDALAIYLADFKLIRRSNRTLLLEREPGDWRYRKVDSPDTGALLEYLESDAKAFLAGEQRAARAELSDDQIEMLRSLGYIQ